MLCKCGGLTIVVDSRRLFDGVRRRRECLSCKERFSTEEHIVNRPVLPPKPKPTPAQEVAAIRKKMTKIRQARNTIEDRLYEKPIDEDVWLREEFTDRWRRNSE